MQSLLILIFFTACSSPAHHKVAVMQNPETKDIQKCEIDPWATWQWEYRNVLQQCVQGYKAAGYERIDRPSSD